MSIRRNTLWNLAGGLLPLCAAAAFVPYTLHRLGNEAFGVLTLIWALIGYFSLFDFGVGRALTYELSKLQSANLLDEIPATIKSGVLLTALTGIVGCIIMIILTPWLTSVGLKVGLGWQDEARRAFQYASLGVIFTTITSGLRGALEGLGRFAASNVNKIFLGICMFLLPAVVVYIHGASLAIITIYLVGARLLVLIWSLFQLKQYLFSKGASLTLRNVKSLISFGGWMTITGIVGPLMVYGDRFFVSATVGSALLPYYALPQEGLQRLLIIPVALCGALLPHFATLQHEELEKAYRQNFKRVLISMSFVCFFAAVLVYPVLKVWLSAEFANHALPIALILVIGIWFNSVALVPYTFLHACGDSRITALLHLAELFIYVVILYYLTNLWGLIGAAVAWVLRVLLDLLLLQKIVERYLLQNVEVTAKNSLPRVT